MRIVGQSVGCIRVVRGNRIGHAQMARLIIADVEDSAAAGFGRVVLHDGAGDIQIICVPVGIYRSSAPAARRSGPRRIRATTDSVIITNQAVQDGDGRAQAADGAPVRAIAALPAGVPEGTLHDVDRILAVGGVRIVEVIGASECWAYTRMAPPPRSGAVGRATIARISI